MNERVQYLLNQYENNNCSRGEMEELFSYIRSLGNGHEELKGLIKQVYDNICKDHPSFSYVTEKGQLIFTDPEKPDAIGQFPPVTDGNLRVFKAYRRVLVAAAALIVISLLMIGVKRFTEDRANAETAPVAMQTFSTSLGQTKMFILPDSSQVWLNANSSLEVPEKFQKGDRKVKLVGEALFKVRRKPETSFAVKAADLVVKSLESSSYNIKAYPGENDIVLSIGQGIVSVEASGKKFSGLSPGRMLRLGKVEKSITEKNFPLQNFAAWQWGEMVYENTMFKDIISDLQRRKGTVIIFNNPEKEKLRISASFKNGTDMEQIMHSLAGITQSRIDTTDDGFVIY